MKEIRRANGPLSVDRAGLQPFYILPDEYLGLSA